MAKKINPKKSARPGNSKASAEARRLKFVKHYISNGNNGVQAAISAGYSPKGAAVTASRLLTLPNISQALEQERERAAAATGLTVERTLRELARIAYQDPRKLFHANGAPRAIHELDDDTAATVASFEIEEQTRETGRGKSKKRTVASFIRRVKAWDKNAALEKAMKYHKLYSDDVPQHGTVIIIGASTLDEDI